MSQTNFSVKLIIISILTILLGGMFAADTVGLVNLKLSFLKLPLINSYFKNDNNINQINLSSPLIEENKKLKEEYANLSKKIIELEKEKNNFTKDLSNLSSQITELKNENEKLKQRKINATQLAEYYSEMKAQDVSEIMKELDDELILEVFALLESDQIAKILTNFDTARSVRLSKKIMNK